MTDVWGSIRLTEFEHVVTGPTQSLLRVCGQTPSDDAPEPRPVLVIAAADGEARFRPLRAPDDHHGVIRAAYAVPTALVTAGAGCWLETHGGDRVALPAPVEGTGRRRDDELASVEADVSEAAAERPEVGDAPVADDPAEALRDAEAQIRSLAQKVTELERARDDDRRAAAAVTAQAETRAQSAEEREATATERAESAEQATQLAHSRAATLETELAAQVPAREALREEIAELRARGHRLERELDQSRDQLRLMTVERDELERQAAAYDEVAVKARERATAAETAKERTTAALDELQAWRAELERRLAEATTELGALRTRRDEDERELLRLRAAAGEDGPGRRPAAANGADSEGGEEEITSIQAEEIQRLAAELAELRSRTARGG